MSPTTLLEILVTAGRVEDYAAVIDLPGAGVHAQVLRFSNSLRRDCLVSITKLSSLDRKAFAKALAIYENTVGGLGSVTALERVLPLVSDEDHAVLDWILSNTRSYWYYAHGAKSFAELESIKADNAARRARNELREAEREQPCRVGTPVPTRK